MLKLYFLLVFANSFFLYISYVSSENWCGDVVYCERSKTNLVNFRCERNYCALNNTCGRVAKRMRITYLVKLFIIRFINQYRRAWCEGSNGPMMYKAKEKDVGGTLDLNFKCTYMNVLSWHDDLAEFSQCVSNTCYEHFENVRNEEFSNITCNNQMYSLTTELDMRGYAKIPHKIVQDVLMSWIPDRYQTKREDFLTFGEFLVKTRRFEIAAMMTPNAKYIGCAATAFQETKLYFVCFVDQSTKIGKVLFENGKIGSKCSSDMEANISHTNLCGTTKHVFNFTSKTSDFFVILKFFYVILLIYLT